MYKILIISILFVQLIASHEQQSNINIWNKKEKPSIENNFQENHKIYHTNSIGEAVSVTLIESLFHTDKIIEKKKLNSDFKYLEEFKHSIQMNNFK